MPNARIFAPEYSTDSIWRDNDMTRCLSDDLDAIEADIAALQASSGGANITVDSELSVTSTNPVQNAVVTEAINGLSELVGDTTVSEQISTAVAEKANAIHTHSLSDITDMPNYATETYVNTKVADLVDSSPDTLNTLNELAAALGDDPNFATTVATQIGGKVDKVDGKDLSSNDYTDEEKTKLSGIETGANKTTVDVALSDTSTNPVQNKVVSVAINNLNSLVGDTAVSTQISNALSGKSDINHTHKYAGSSSAGGAATSANKLNTNAGGATQPVYFANGVPVATTYTLGKSVPSNAVFTDTTALGSMTGTLPISKGGTGATTAADARSAIGALAKDGDTMSGNLTIFSGGTSSVVLRAPDDSDGDQAYSRIYKNASATADYGLQLRDLAHGGNETNTSCLLMICDKQSDVASKLQFVRQLNGTNTYYKLYGEHNKPTLSDIGITATAAEVNKLDGLTATTAELNYVDGVTSNIQTQLNGKAASSHGTHVTFATTAPKAAGTASVGSASTVSRSDHVHPVQTTVSGNAGSATKLATARTIRTNLGSTSTASFDGSANVTPGVSGTLPIANGGTGATTAAAAVTNLGIADYVVAQGTSGIWTYRKWNSGVSECWGSITINYQIDCTIQQVAGVYTDSTFKNSSASLPSGVFTSVSFATANARSSGYSIAQVSGLSATTLTYRMWCPYPTLLNTNAVIDFHVKGRWK